MRQRAVKSFCLSKHHHPSMSEADYCDWLWARKEAGEIKNYKVWPSVAIKINGRHWKNWKIDFWVLENDGTESYHESKGWNRSDDSFRLKRDAFLLAYPKIKLYINKELYTGAPNRKRLTKWTMAEVVRRNKKAAISRAKMAFAREKILNQRNKTKGE